MLESTFNTSIVYVNTLESIADPFEKVRVVEKEQLLLESPVKLILIGTGGDFM